jgi:hypothetical protein
MMYAVWQVDLLEERICRLVVWFVVWLCGVGARANERGQTTRGIHQPSKPDARVPSTTQVQPADANASARACSYASVMASLDSNMTNKHEGIICGRLAEAEAAQEQKTYLSPDPSLSPLHHNCQWKRNYNEQNTEH